MTTPTPPTPPTPPAAPPAPPAAPSAQQPPKPDGGQADRLAAVEAKVASHDGKLDGIGSKLDQLIGQGTAKPKGGDSGPSGVDVAALVRQGVEEIDAKRRRDKEAADAKQADADWRKSVETQLAERKPAEPRTGRRSKLQRFLFGAPDEQR
jgi:hypothetical protein